MKAKPANHASEEVRRAIEVRAYLIWEGEGRPQGREREHWLRAEAEVAGRKPVKKAATAKTNGTVKPVVAAKVKRASKSKPAKTAHPEN